MEDQTPDKAPNYVGSRFDPGQYLTMIGNSQYLEVKWRLVWLRQQDPEASISTDLVEHDRRADDPVAVFKATITLTTGASATGWAMESRNDFRDYLQKAETASIGRALAALGYGTQFTPDYDLEQQPSGQGRTRIADAPVDFASSRDRRAATPGGPQQTYTPNSGSNAPQTVTDRQLKFIKAIAREAGLDEAAIRQDVQDSFGCAVEELCRKDASEYIERLQSLRNQQPIAT